MTISDIILDIATGKGRNETSWQNRKISWTALTEKLRETHRTAETLSEYTAMPKGRQDEIKDIGGFVGGMLVGGKRSKTTVMHRTLITLDLDSAPIGFWASFQLLYDCAACIYSTHKHTPEAPRYRLLIPLSRAVDPTEYEAIGRYIAGELGIEYFDNTGFQHYRLMYWPSTSKDGVYEYQQQDGPLLDPDEVLRLYADYRDSSQWPVSARVNERIDREIKKQGDPLQKRGIIGAFCRCYSVTEALETFLLDVYEQVSGGDRYTYLRGSTAGGLVVYEDKWTYSHHGTDPTSGRLCNAFDLVRLHLFGLQDEDVSRTVPTTKLPSYKSMLDFVRKDPAVKVLIGEEMQAEAETVFSVPEDATEYPDAEPAGVITLINDNVQVSDLKDYKSRAGLGVPFPPRLADSEDPAEIARTKEWMALLEYDDKMKLKSTIDNLRLILLNDRLLRGRIAFDEFQRLPVVLGSVPWQTVEKDYDRGRLYEDHDAAGLRFYIEKLYEIHAKDKLKDAVLIASKEIRFHPIRNYLGGLQWDGVPRLSGVLTDYLGAEPRAYTSAVLTKWMTAGVARIYEPGIKFDYALTFTGEEGVYKSTFFRLLADPWFSDDFSFDMIGTTRAIEAIAGKWIVEVPEMTGFGKKEIEAIKAFVGRQRDRQRGAYKENTSEKGRQCVFGASTNDPEPLRGTGGHRRFWIVPVRVGEPRKAIMQLAVERDQLWAEAVHLYNSGESLALPSELEAEARLIQWEHTEKDDRFYIIQDYLERKVPAGWNEMDTWARKAFLNGDLTAGEGVILRDRVSVAEIWTECLGCHIKDMNQNGTRPIHEIMRKIPGWERPGAMRINGKLVKGYQRKGSKA